MAIEFYGQVTDSQQKVGIVGARLVFHSGANQFQTYADKFGVYDVVIADSSGMWLLDVFDDITNTHVAKKDIPLGTRTDGYKYQVMVSLDALPSQTDIVAIEVQENSLIGGGMVQLANSFNSQFVPALQTVFSQQYGISIISAHFDSEKHLIIIEFPRGTLQSAGGSLPFVIDDAVYILIAVVLALAVIGLLGLLVIAAIVYILAPVAIEVQKSIQKAIDTVTDNLLLQHGATADDIIKYRTEQQRMANEAAASNGGNNDLFGGIDKILQDLMWIGVISVVAAGGFMLLDEWQKSRRK